MRRFPVLRRLAAAVAVSSSLVFAVPAAAQELKIAVAADVTSIDPHFFNLFPNNNIAEHIFDKLVQMDPDSRMIPGLATSWKTHRRQDVGVQAAQGRQVPRRQRADRRGRRVLDRPRADRCRTARARSPRTRRRSTKIEIVDPYTIRFKYAAPYPLAPNDLSTIYIVSKKVATGATTEDFNSGKAAVGSGRYKFVRYANGDRVELVRNDALLGRQAGLREGAVQDHQGRGGAHGRAAVGRRRRDRAAADRRPRAAEERSQVHADVEDLAPRHLLQLRPPRALEPVHHGQGRQAARQEPAARRPRPPRDLQGDQPARDRRARDGGPGDPVGPARVGEALRPQPGAEARGLRPGRGQEAACGSGLSERLQPDDPRAGRPLRQRREDRAGGRADALAHRHRREGRDGADGAVLGPRGEAGVQLPHGRLGRVDRRGVVAAALAARDVQPRQGAGRGELGPLFERQGRLPDRAGAAAGQRREPADHAPARDRPVDAGPGHHADPLPVHDVGDEEERAVRAAHGRVHAGVPVQAGEVSSAMPQSKWLHRVPRRRGERRGVPGSRAERRQRCPTRRRSPAPRMAAARDARRRIRWRGSNCHCTPDA